MKNTVEKIKIIAGGRYFWPTFALAIVLLSNLFLTNNFFKIEIKDGHLYGRVIDIIKNATPLMLLAIGMTLVIATKGIDISVSSICAISGAIAAVMVGGNLNGVPENLYIVAILAALAASTILGMWNGLLVAKLGIQPVIATLILMVAGRGIAQLITGGQIITVYYKPYSFLGSAYIPFIGLPFSILIVAIVLVLTLLLMNKTSLGLFIQSTGINKNASEFSGIKVKKIIFMTYAFCGFCAGIAGLIISSNVKCADANNAALFIELDAILAVALGSNSLNGGRFSIVASIIGALVIQSLTTTMYAIGIKPPQLPFVKAIVVIIICLIQSGKFRSIISGIIRKGKQGGLTNE
jgi:galactofuranose transport system permease protein